MWWETELTMTSSGDAHVEAAVVAPAGHDTQSHGLARRRILTFVPLAAAAGLVGVFAAGLDRDPSIIPSVLVGKHVPEFDLPPVQGRSLGLSGADLRGEVSLINVFASWCIACREEHPIFLRLAREKIVPVHGLNYKDAPEDAARWLDSRGDPYTRTGADTSGRVAIDWGVYGVPETFVVGADGVIAYKHIGAITEQVLSDTILPLVARLREEAAGVQR
jgi:cytochrome c biogenesis protein CcmG, thiol:disulfide interchange protein DsbE